MNRRTILLLAAALVAALGTALVFLYVKGADNRAEERFDTVEVLRAVGTIEQGESIDDAAQSGKLALQPIARDSSPVQRPDRHRRAQRPRGDHHDLSG